MTPQPAPRLLVVDDDEQIRRLYRKLLTKAGFALREAASGKEALDALGEESFALVVLDLSMPDTDGYDLLRMIKERAPGQKTLVISGVISGEMTGALLRMANHFGATATLDKVLASKMLVETVKRLLAEG